MKLLYKKRLKNEELVRTAYHEIGHLILAYLFQNDCEIHKVSINKRKMKKINPNYNAGCQILIKWEYTADILDKEIVIAYGGMCIQSIYKSNSADFNELIPSIVTNPNKFRKDEGCDKDKEIIKKYIQNLLYSTGYTSSQYREYLLQFILDFMTTPECWKAIKCLTEKLLNKWNLELSFKEIQKLLKKCGFEDYLNSNMDIILKKRYPIIYNSKKFNNFRYNKFQILSINNISYEP